MRCFVVAPAFTAMDTDALLYQVYPGLVKCFQRLAVKLLAVDHPRPHGHGGILWVFPYPSGAVMRHVMRIVPPTALANGQIGQFGDDKCAAVVPIRNH